MYCSLKKVFPLVLPLAIASAQPQAPSVSQVLIYSGTRPITTVPITNANGIQTGTVTLRNAVPNVFSGTGDLANSNTNLNNSANYSSLQSLVSITQALNAGIATSLSVIPISSPASGVIFKKDPMTGGDLPASSTLGPIFTERAETIGKNRFYIGISRQNYLSILQREISQ